MLLQLLFIVITAHALVEATPKKKSSIERPATLLYKDGRNGELRFLSGSSNQQQPSNGANIEVTPIIIGLNGGGNVSPIGTFPTSGFGGGNVSPTATFTTSGFGGGNGNAGIGSAVAANGSPITGLLPQIVAQAVANGGGATSPTYPSSPTSAGVLNRIIRPVNRRRRVNRNSGKRRRRRRPAIRPQVVVVRPQYG